MGSQRQAQILVFYQPRSACRLLCRMLFERQTNVVPREHIFGNSRGSQVEWLRSDAYKSGMEASLRAEFEYDTDEAVATWQRTLAESQQNDQILVVQTYPFAAVDPDTVLKVSQMATKREYYPIEGNFTMVPESLLLAEGTVPLIVVRDPRLIVSSAYRVLKDMGIAEGGGRPMYLVTTCTIWSRLLYDYYVSKGVTPIVVDSDDFMTSQDFVQGLCKAIGVDPVKAMFSWPAISPEQKLKMEPMDYASGRSFLESTAVDTSRAAQNMDFVMEEQSWNTDFGDDAPLVREMIELATPHYQYLIDRRWCVDKSHKETLN